MTAKTMNNCKCLERLAEELRKVVEFNRTVSDGCGPERYVATADIHRAVLAAMVARDPDRE